MDTKGWKKWSLKERFSFLVFSMSNGSKDQHEGGEKLENMELEEKYPHSTCFLYQHSPHSNGPWRCGSSKWYPAQEGAHTSLLIFRFGPSIALAAESYSTCSNSINSKSGVEVGHCFFFFTSIKVDIYLLFKNGLAHLGYFLEKQTVLEPPNAMLEPCAFWMVSVVE